MAKKSKRERARDVLESGQEKPSPVPLAPPVGYTRELTMTERIRQMVVGEHVRLHALAQGMETFEEADDFDVGDDIDPSSPYEEVFEPVDSEARMRLRNADFAAKVDARSEEIRTFMEKPDGKPAAKQVGSPDSEVRSGKPDSVSKDDPGKKSTTGDTGSS